jgi:2'-5' RNA ligase
VALELPAAFREPLVKWRAAAYRDSAAARLPRPETLHVTLVFLGYQAERDVERLTELTFAEPPRGFALASRETRGVPPRRPRLHALDLADADGSLTAWQGRLSERLAAARLYEREKRPFWPHVTLARIKRPGADSPQPPTLPAALRVEFTAGRITLYRSTLLPQGARYDALATQAADSAADSSTE